MPSFWYVGSGDQTQDLTDAWQAVNRLIYVPTDRQECRQAPRVFDLRHSLSLVHALESAGEGTGVLNI